jgi:ring-1,2-phenylacetyl-CoA epoxidase subunit PaaD
MVVKDTSAEMENSAKTPFEREEAVWSALENVKDPEIPVISVVDMGMISGIEIGDNNSVTVKLLPTFVGCPALDMMKQDIRGQLLKAGFAEVTVNIDYETRWSSDRMTPEAKIKLEKFGLAPPPELKGEELSEEMLNRVRCPLCGSSDTTLRSSFGSTLCRAIRFCFNCKQSFEQFKPVQ